jgi:membrane protein DedA with SNARE-associated domain
VKLGVSKIFPALVTLAPAVAFAHPGHGGTDPASWVHHLTEPLHVAVLAGAAVAIGAAVYWRRMRRARARRASR